MPAPDITPPTLDELGRLQTSIAADDPELAMFARLSAMTGARRSEMLALRWPDVDLEGGVVTISRGIVMGPDGLVEKDTKTHQGEKGRARQRHRTAGGTPGVGDRARRGVRYQPGP